MNISQLKLRSEKFDDDDDDNNDNDNDDNNNNNNNNNNSGSTRPSAKHEVLRRKNTTHRDGQQMQTVPTNMIRQ